MKHPDSIYRSADPMRPDQSTKLSIWSKLTIVAISPVLLGFGILLSFDMAREVDQREHGSCQQFKSEDISNVPARCFKEFTNGSN